MIATTSYSNLSGKEISEMIDLCNGLHRGDSGQSFLRHCHDVMHQTIGNVHFSAEFYQIDPLTLTEQVMPTIDQNEYNGYWLPLFNEHILEHPLAKRLVTDPKSEIGATHRETALKIFRQSALFNEYYDHVQAQNQLWVAIRHENILLNCVYSRENEYTENEQAMLYIIQPHLDTAWKNWKRTRKLKEELALLKAGAFQSVEEAAAAARLQGLIDALTPRQRGVVELVAGGMDNQQIADELKISVLTVKKHLQSIFQNMDVQHRTQLSAKWHQARSVTLN